MVSEGGLARMREPDLDALAALLDHRRDRLDFGGEFLSRKQNDKENNDGDNVQILFTCSILYRLKRSSYVIRDIARPRCPYRPDRPMR